MRAAPFMIAGLFALIVVAPVAAAPGGGGGEFPGKGNGVGGSPGTFPGGGATGGVFPGKGNGVSGGTVSTTEPLSLFLTGIGLVSASLLLRRRQ
jgi:hypothetical protein